MLIINTYQYAANLFSAAFNPLQMGHFYENFNKVICSCFSNYNYCRGSISSRFSSNSEASASEFQKILKKRFLGTTQIVIYWCRLKSSSHILQCVTRRERVNLLDNPYQMIDLERGCYDNTILVSTRQRRSKLPKHFLVR